MINSQPKIPFLGVVFDVDHDFEGLRAPKAHLATVLTNPVTSPGQALYSGGTQVHLEGSRMLVAALPGSRWVSGMLTFLTRSMAS